MFENQQQQQQQQQQQKCDVAQRLFQKNRGEGE